MKYWIFGVEILALFCFVAAAAWFSPILGLVVAGLAILLGTFRFEVVARGEQPDRKSN